MNIKDEFAKKCKEIYSTVNTGEACQDEFVMLIDFKYNKPVIDIVCSNGLRRDLNYITKIESEDCDTIALVLESPHELEYDENGNAIGPAMGKTGENIGQYLFPKLKSRLKTGRYKVLLIEAISFQCSNGIQPIDGPNRDLLFSHLWQNGAKDDFKKRLKRYRPKYIINACTGGIKNIDSNKTLNSLVDQAIKEIKCEKYFYSVHPCSVWFKIKRLLERKE